MGKIISWLSGLTLPSLWPWLLGGFLTCTGGAYLYGHHAGVRSVAASVAQSVAMAEKAARLDQGRRDNITLAAAVSEAKAQQKIQVHTQFIKEKVNVYVHSKAMPCVPFGLVRLLDATILNADPASLPLPTGQSDDACSPVDADALAQSILANYSASQSNSEQLDALIAWAKSQESK